MLGTGPHWKYEDQQDKYPLSPVIVGFIIEERNGQKDPVIFNGGKGFKRNKQGGEIEENR